jgi:hypothetical protein
MYDARNRSWILAGQGVDGPVTDIDVQSLQNNEFRLHIKGDFSLANNEDGTPVQCKQSILIDLKLILLGNSYVRWDSISKRFLPSPPSRGYVTPFKSKVVKFLVVLDGWPLMATMYLPPVR